MQATTIHSFRISADGTRASRGKASLLFPYWSFTKTVIAICALKLHESGKVDLDDEITGERFTLRQLLNHTAGLPDYASLVDYHRAVAAEEPPWPRDRLLGATMAKGFLFAPGQSWAYSNVGYMLAKEWIEAASGLSLAALVEETVSRPLGLKSLELATTREQFRRVHWRGADSYHPGWVYHGCLMGTAEDAALLLHGLVTGALLSESMLGEMRQSLPLGGALEGRPWTECSYGLGLMIGSFSGSGRVIGHTGGGPFSTNAVYHFPDVDRGVTVASFSDGLTEGGAEFEASDFALSRCSFTA
ncbi:serine hydrolase [Pleomorphomonas sp. JP5]|uniref:serine hydrolase domain-containing protein n=1 Tax=Pleomorphomonas sp. JP5 TaxID=2942998 RepID=UPI00204469FC|nr:serine hydrolase domain-containing protein [Pleomorphomonas sp. JP5]MCM5560168.1 beta-lactamase family protein [Pleomorphomonas sp. JP5]